MSRLGAAIAAAIIVVLLAGCASASIARFTRTEAQADAATWTSDALAALTPTPKVTPRSNTYERCRTDTGFFDTASEWRSITDVAVPAAGQPAAIDAIASALEAKGWKRSGTSALTTLRGPSGDKHTGVVLLQSDGDSELSVSVVSPCYA